MRCQCQECQVGVSMSECVCVPKIPPRIPPPPTPPKERTGVPPGERHRSDGAVEVSLGVAMCVGRGGRLAMGLRGGEVIETGPVVEAAHHRTLGPGRVDDAVRVAAHQQALGRWCLGC